MTKEKKEKMKALINETLQRLEEEGLTMREARWVASEIEHEIAKASLNAAFHFQDPEAGTSTITDRISSENL